MIFIRVFLGTLLGLFTAYNFATTVNNGIVQQQHVAITDQYKNDGTIKAATIVVNDSFYNAGSVTANSILVAAGCNRVENRGYFDVGQLELPSHDTSIKLYLNKTTTIGSIYRGTDYMGGIQFMPSWSRGNKKTIKITDYEGIEHTFTDTQENLEKFLEKALNEKQSAVALIAYLRAMTRK